MNGVCWARVVEEALRRHDDAPDVAQLCAVAVELYPRYWGGNRLLMLPVVAGFELRQTVQRVAFLKAAARERGLRPGMRVAEIRAVFGRGFPARRSFYGSTRTGRTV